MNIDDRVAGAASGIDRYHDEFDDFASQQGSNDPAWLRPIRRAAIAELAEKGFPTPRDEEWRFTNIAPLTRLPFHLPSRFSANELPGDVLPRLPLTGLKTARLTFVNGQYAPQWSIVPPALCHQIRNLAGVLAEGGPAAALVEKQFGQQSVRQQNAFVSLNTAFFQDGAVIIVPRGAAWTDPVHLLFISTAAEAGTALHPRNFILAEEASKATVIESYASLSEAAYFTNTVTELRVGAESSIEHCKFQDESLASFHIGTLQARMGRNAFLISHSIATGSRLARNHIYTDLAAEGVQCLLNGLYLTQGDQLIDHFMIVEHAKPHCESHEYYNGILDDRSKAVFHGRILVRPDAQKTDAKQTNKNLLLSDEATVDTKPQLEIYADDVKCTHGATVGQLDPESIFYLRARGIGLERARRMLMQGFAGEIIDRIKFEPLRSELDGLIWRRLEARPKMSETEGDAAQKLRNLNHSITSRRSEAPPR